ncbi:MAG: winged helix-turn-helix transcriptional regulator [Burkholderiales bacterium]|nr:winged helix-turn-helix transcriptional regulator [Burkholderiales bacterium]
MQAILDHLKKTGEQLDAEIAAATGLSLASVRQHVTQLQSRGDVMICKSIRYKDGKPTEGMLCRISGYIPPVAPGRKPKAVVAAKQALESSN